MNGINIGRYLISIGISDLLLEELFMNNYFIYAIFNECNTHFSKVRIFAVITGEICVECAFQLEFYLLIKMRLYIK